MRHPRSHVRLVRALTEAGWAGHAAGVRAALLGATLPVTVAGSDRRLLEIRNDGGTLAADQVTTTGGRVPVATEHGPVTPAIDAGDRVRTVRIPDGLWLRMNEAVRDGRARNRSELIRAAVERYLGGES